MRRWAQDRAGGPELTQVCCSWDSASGADRTCQSFGFQEPIEWQLSTAAIILCSANTLHLVLPPKTIRSITEQIFVHVFHMPGTVLGVGNTTVSKTRNNLGKQILRGFYSLVGERDNYRYYIDQYTISKGDNLLWRKAAWPSESISITMKLTLTGESGFLEEVMFELNSES